VTLYSRNKKILNKRFPYIVEPLRGLPDGTVVDSETVAQIEFLEWTDGDHLRHCKFAGLCDDKAPRNVVKERCNDAPGLFVELMDGIQILGQWLFHDLARISTSSGSPTSRQRRVDSRRSP
jgi:hypothetical protein